MNKQRAPPENAEIRSGESEIKRRSFFYAPIISVIIPASVSAILLYYTWGIGYIPELIDCRYETGKLDIVWVEEDYYYMNFTVSGEKTRTIWFTDRWSPTKITDPKEAALRYGLSSGWIKGEVNDVALRWCEIPFSGKERIRGVFVYE